MPVDFTSHGAFLQRPFPSSAESQLLTALSSRNAKLNSAIIFRASCSTAEKLLVFHKFRHLGPNLGSVAISQVATDYPALLLLTTRMSQNPKLKPAKRNKISTYVRSLVGIDDVIATKAGLLQILMTSTAVIPAPEQARRRTGATRNRRYTEIQCHTTFFRPLDSRGLNSGHAERGADRNSRVTTSVGTRWPE